MSAEKNRIFFIAGRGLKWPFIGISIIAANISTEHFIGMAGSGYETGLAVGSHEWTAAIALVIISIYILPKYMSVGVKTIPEYLELRFNHWSRLVVAIFIILFTIFIQFASVIYASSLAIGTIFDTPQYYILILFAVLTAIFTLIGGLSSVVRTNIVFAATFLIGGALVTFKGIYEVGGIAAFVEKSQGKLTSLLPIDNNYMPWTTALIGGLWVAQFYYFGFNQFITQYLLSGKTLSDAQKGVLLAATIKLMIPIIAIFPGIIAFEIFGDTLANPDLAYPKLIEYLSGSMHGLKAMIFCTLVAATVSSLNSMMIAAADVFTHDIFIRYFKQNASNSVIAKTGRISTVIFILLGCTWAPLISKFHASFEYIQKFAGMISPGILAVFLIAMFTKRIPSFVANLILLLSVPLYFLLLNWFGDFSFYDIMGASFIILLALSIILGRIFALKDEVIMPEKFEIKFERNLLVIIWSIFLITLIAFLYLLF
ncbi:MAG: sodium/solute symporter [Cytophagaceae bacterium]|nr:sodium/solute symporter [Cytophagaceae bacterium]